MFRFLPVVPSPLVVPLQLAVLPLPLLRRRSKRRRKRRRCLLFRSGP
jgi:hypothetical protein